MAIDDQLVPFYFKTSPGMDNHTDELDLNGQRVRLAQNCRFEDEPGGASKRPNLAYYNAQEMGVSGPLLGTYRFYSANGAKQICVRDSGVYVGDDATGSMTLIRTLTTSDLRMSFVTYNKLMMACNGTDNIFVYDGSSDNITWELGSCKAKVGSSTGITKTGISYQVEITLATGSYVCGAISNEIASVTNQSIELSYIPLGPIGTLNRKIYRKDSGTAGYRLIATINNNTNTTFTDTIADASTGLQIGTVTDDMPKGNILLIHRERLFVSGMSGSESRIGYSEPFLPHIIQIDTELSYMDIAKDDGDKITAVKNWQGTMIVWKQNNLRKIGVASALSGADPTSWYVEDPIAQIGTPAPWSVVETPFGVVFLSWDSWFVYDGGIPKAIISQFNCQQILPSLYSSVVSYFNTGMLYAAYADKETTPDHNNRIMCYDYLLDKMSLDTIEANCFTSASGVDEKSELYIGSSVGGWLFKAEEGDNWHRLSGKTQANKGTMYSSFVGGSESSPTIEIGSLIPADPIPTNLCIFWADESISPGPGWTEVTAALDKFIYISSSSVGATGGIQKHSHSITATINISKVRLGMCGDSGRSCTKNQHTHTASITSSEDEALPNNVRLRVFYKNSTTTEYLFPVGALILWDQGDEPDGWLARSDFDTCYIRCASTNLIPDRNPTHSHTASGTTSSDGLPGDADIGYSPGVHPAAPHNHPLSITVNSGDDSGWLLNAIEFRIIQKVGEESPWDGANKYCYCLFHANSGLSGGWVDVSANYEGRYIRAGSNPLSTTSRSSGHQHTALVIVEENEGFGGEGGYHNSWLMNHTHTATGTVSSVDKPDPPYYSFRLVKKVLGKMSGYNDAIGNIYTSGLYKSAAIQVNAESLGKMYMNTTKGSLDSITIYFKSADTESGLDPISATSDSATDVITSVSHGLSNGRRVTITGSSIDDSIVYYVINSSNDTFKVSLTENGTPVNISISEALSVEAWGYGISISGEQMDVPSSSWIQYLVEFKASDSTTSLPKLYTADGYMFKFNYRRAGEVAEEAVEFIYDTGNLNFDEPMLDKIFKKIISEHSGTQGSLTISWETENATGSFSFDLAKYPKRWSSFFQSNAMGSTIRIRFYKNDLYPVTLKEFKGLLSPQPMLI